MLELVCVEHLVLALEIQQQIAAMLLMISVHVEELQHAQWLKKRATPEHVCVELLQPVMEILPQMVVMLQKINVHVGAGQRVP